jgi:hypothetical protein
VKPRERVRHLQQGEVAGAAISGTSEESRMALEDWGGIQGVVRGDSG